MLLRIERATISHAAVVAVREANIFAESGATITIIGANGAGKTTLLRAVSGLKKIAAGEIYFDGRRIDGLPPEEIVALGIAHVPEGRSCFSRYDGGRKSALGCFFAS